MLAKHAARCWEIAGEVTHDNDGAPAFAGTNTFLSLAHSQDVVAIALSETRIGIDVETVSRRVDFKKIAKRFFSDDEWALVQKSVEPRSTFFELWTKKEAVLKAERIGLTIPLKDVNFDSVDSSFGYTLRTRERDDWIAAVAHDDPVEIQIFDWASI